MRFLNAERHLTGVLGQKWLKRRTSASDSQIARVETVSNYLRSESLVSTRNGAMKSAAKLRFSCAKPARSQVFTREVIAEATQYADVNEQRVSPMLREDLKTLEKWARVGRIARIDFTHLIFLIWSVTQTYADLAPQFAMLLGKPKLDGQYFEAAESVLTRLVMAG